MKRRAARRRAPSARIGARASTVRTPGSAADGGHFPIVGVGASAGALGAYQAFFRATPADSGAAFVLVQHLDPTHESLTVELLRKHTAMPVMQVEQETRVERNHVYVIPPNRYLSIEGGTLRLTTPSEPRGMRMPIDVFFRSLATDQHERSVGIVLSGTGTDGALGLKEIKAAGGMTMAQAPESAQYDGMPRSAIATGGVDHVLPIVKMPRALSKYMNHAYVARAAAVPLPAEPSDDLNPILVLLRTRAGFDFGAYKKGTVRRRVQRRMSLRQIASVADYLRLLQGDPEEMQALRKDLLIGVTSFFRDPQVWRVFAEQLIPHIVESKKASQPLRVWVPGCATGEEAYTLAILLVEHLQAVHKSPKLQIFASDVDTEALEVARAGVYPESISTDVSPAHLQRFFAKDGQSYGVVAELRECVIFATQNLLTDAPFSNLDLISCRNVLMYLEPAVQERVIGLFHFGLLEGGYLLLGSTETVGDHEHLFEPFARRAHIYRRIGPTRHDKVAVPVTVPSPGVTPQLSGLPHRVAAVAQQFLLDRYAPASVVVTRKGEMLHFSGRTQDYLSQPAGAATQDLFAQVREGLQAKVRTAVQKAAREDGAVVVTGAVGRDGKGYRRVKISAEPLKVPPGGEPLILVSFADERSREEPPPAGSGAVEDSVAGQLEWELKATRDELRSAVAQLQSSNEELKAANEEVMSANEELQSTNEELQTSKEELQSVNEELSTVNAQLQSKVDELERANNDLDNLLAATTVATIFLDREFRIRRFTPMATRLFNLIPSDVGRPLSDMVPRFTDPELLSDAGVVLDDLSPRTKEVQTRDGHWYMREVVPYCTRDKRIEGVVIAFSDVAAGALREARLYAETIVDTVREALLVLDADLRVVSANRPYYAMFRTSREQTENRLLHELGEHEGDVPALRQALAGVLPGKKGFVGFELTRESPGLGRRTLLLGARPLPGGATRPDLILLAIDDVTERRRHQQALEEAESKLRAIVGAAPDGIVTIDDTGSIIAFNRAAERIFGFTASEAIGRNVSIVMPPPYGDNHRSYVERYLRTGVAHIIGTTRELTGRRKDGTTFPLELSIGEYHDGTTHGFVGIVRDVTARKKAEADTERHHGELARALRVGAMGELAAGLAHELNQPLSAIANTLAACVTRLRAGTARPSTIVRLIERAMTDVIRTGEIVRHVRGLVQNREPRRESVDLRGLIEGVIRLLAGELKAYRVAVRLELGGRPLPVRVVRIQIEQVLLNLVQNAIDAIRIARTGRREIAVRAAKSAAGVIGVAVQDTGTGVSEGVAQRLFEPLFTTKQGGLGMGLAISHSIIEAHDGRLWVAPEERGPGGATFRFTLPLAGASGARRAPARTGRARTR